MRKCDCVSSNDSIWTTAIAMKNPTDEQLLLQAGREGGRGEKKKKHFLLIITCNYVTKQRAEVTLQCGRAVFMSTPRDTVAP